ncbi:MAG: hypothetical protein S4CHLAM7_05040 [Chlamydiae bacterium]|nr:hypothetical protein [Chlamydiota bacterium]
MAIILAFSAAFLCAINNLFLRKSIDAGGSSKGFLVTAMSFAFAVAVYLGPVRTGFFAWSNAIALIGLVAGLLLGVMMWSLGKALEKGPAGLTIAYLNASNIVPAIFMMLLFGVAYGYTYAWWNAFGSALVIIGLFWAVWQTSKTVKSQSFWLVFATISFFTHVLFLMLIQWRALVIRPGLPESLLLPFTIDATHSEWFMPMLFVGATLFLLYRYKIEENKSPNRVEVSFGLVGGACNGTGTYLLIRAAQLASPWESAMLFPLYAVGIVLICNIWGKVLYKEQVHWKAMSLCSMGLFVGTVDWSSMLR